MCVEWSRVVLERISECNRMINKWFKSRLEIWSSALTFTLRRLKLAAIIREGQHETAKSIPKAKNNYKRRTREIFTQFSQTLDVRRWKPNWRSFSFFSAMNRCLLNETACPRSELLVKFAGRRRWMEKMENKQPGNNFAKHVLGSPDVITTLMLLDCLLHISICMSFFFCILNWL